jgi:hypothetical protein
MTSIENPVVYKYVPPLADIKQRIVQLDSIQDANEYNKARITLRNDVLSYQGSDVYDTVMNIPGRVTSPVMASSMPPPPYPEPPMPQYPKPTMAPPIAIPKTAMPPHPYPVVYKYVPPLA